MRHHPAARFPRAVTARAERTSRTAVRWLLALCLPLLAGALVGCTLIDKVAGRTARTPARPDSPTSEGYSLLYEIVSQQKHVDTLLLIKVESDAVDRIIGEISSYAATLEERLVGLAKDDPRLDLGRQILPEMAVRTRQSIQAEQLKELLGATGKDFERRLLLSVSGPLNQARHLARVMREAETSRERKAFWQDVQTRLDAQYRRVMGLLEERYFS